jgi:anti-sigma-K factor RskA
MTPHLSPDTLGDLAADLLDQEAHFAATNHVDACEQCRAALAGHLATERRLIQFAEHRQTRVAAKPKRKGLWTLAALIPVAAAALVLVVPRLVPSEPPPTLPTYTLELVPSSVALRGEGGEVAAAVAWSAGTPLVAVLRPAVDYPSGVDASVWVVDDRGPVSWNVLVAGAESGALRVTLDPWSAEHGAPSEVVVQYGPKGTGPEAPTLGVLPDGWVELRAPVYAP